MTDPVKILVAEDNSFVRMQIVRYLADEGHDMVEAENGDEALDVMAKQDINLGIVDVRMKPIDGLSFIRTVRSMDIDIPFVLVTGDNDPNLLEQAAVWGVGAILIKPVQKERLIKTVERAIQSYRKKA